MSTHCSGKWLYSGQKMYWSAKYSFHPSTSLSWSLLFHQSLLLFSCSVVSNSLQSHGLQHTRLHCPSPSPRARSNSGPLSQWSHPAILSSIIPFSSCLQSFPASGPFLMSQFCASKCWSFSFSNSLSNEYSGLIFFRIDWVWTCSPLDSLQHHSSKASILWSSAFFMVQFSHPYVAAGKTIALIVWTFVSKEIFLLFNVLSRFVIAFLPRSKCLLTSWLQSLSTV